MAHPERVSPDETRELLLAYISADGYAAANREMRAAPFEHPDRVTIPVTLAWGERDRLVGPPSPARIPPGARVLTMPGWGHTPTWDDPEGVAGLILEASAAVGPAERAIESRLDHGRPAQPAGGERWDSWTR